MRAGREKGNFRLVLIDLKTKKTKTTTIYAHEKGMTLDQLNKKVIESLNTGN